MKKNEKIYKKDDGITLIALIVMIIVLVILAGISAVVLTGNNGIINRAKEAKDSTEYSQAKEEAMEKWYQVEKEAIRNNYSDDEKKSIFEEKLESTDAEAEVTLKEKSVEVQFKGYKINIPKN